MENLDLIILTVIVSGVFIVFCYTLLKNIETKDKNV